MSKSEITTSQIREACAYRKTGFYSLRDIADRMNLNREELRGAIEVWVRDNWQEFEEIESRWPGE